LQLTQAHTAHRLTDTHTELTALGTTDTELTALGTTDTELTAQCATDTRRARCSVCNQHAHKAHCSGCE
ncbi:hypothetical protein chiPu_0026667, partial [Chiloscyllium punctatum]|nr:hypothetical protein [Chiloscyllium punctatum]